MTRVAEILLRARDTLADPNGERWSEGRLLRLIDEGQLDIAKQTRVLKGEAILQPVQGQHTYSLPEDVWMLTRASYDDCKIPFYSHSELDEFVRTRSLSQSSSYYDNNSSSDCDYVFGDYCWEAETGLNVEALVYDRRDFTKIRLFPIPNSEDLPLEGTGFGVVTGLDGFTLSSPFGVVTSIGGKSSGSTVHIWYIKTPRTIKTSTDALDIPAMWDSALKHYVVASAFDDDMDTRFQEKSAKAFSLYQRELEVMQKTDTLDGVRASQFRTHYRGGFE